MAANSLLKRRTNLLWPSCFWGCDRSPLSSGSLLGLQDLLGSSALAEV